MLISMIYLERSEFRNNPRSLSGINSIYIQSTFQLSTHRFFNRCLELDGLTTRARITNNQHVRMTKRRQKVRN